MKISTEDKMIDYNVRRKAQTGRKLRVDIPMKVLIALMCLAVSFWHMKIASAAKEFDSAEEYLEKTGMSLSEIEALDSDARQFIVDDLRNSGVRDWKINRDIQTLTKTSSEQYTVVFYINVFAFQAEAEHRIYVVYESSTGIMPVGNDSLSLYLGDSFSPNEYGGRIWHKKVGDGSWVQGDGLIVDYQTAEGGMFTGRQLGDFQRKMLVKGCVCCYAGEGTGQDNRVTVEYTYHPSKENNETGLYVMIVAVTVVVVLILRRRE